MRLFGKVDNQINRFDRAWLLWPPFDLSIHETTAGPYHFIKTATFLPGCVATDTVRL